ncbi:MAG TPA: DUF4124 domain-containing protein [Casimicrobiaceae bacterium]
MSAGLFAAALLALVASSSSASAADLYRCVDRNGTVVYQDYACGTSGKVFHTWPEGQRSQADNESLARLKAQVAQMEQTRKARETQFAIEGIERELRGYDQAEEDELAPLRAKQGYTLNNSSAAPWERTQALDAIEKEMQAVKAKYAEKRRAAQERLAQLRKPPESASATR